MENILQRKRLLIEEISSEVTEFSQENYGGLGYGWGYNQAFGASRVQNLCRHLLYEPCKNRVQLCLGLEWWQI